MKKRVNEFEILKSSVNVGLVPNFDFILKCSGYMGVVKAVGDLMVL